MRRHLYYYTHLENSFEAASALLRGYPGAWLPYPAQADARDRWLVDLSAEGVLPHAVARHQVVVGVAPPSATSQRVLRPITWRSGAAPGLFPVFDGDVELSALSGEMCQLSLIGTYRPPLAVAGGAADALLGHHIAEACVRRFVLDTATRMSGVTLAG